MSDAKTEPLVQRALAGHAAIGLLAGAILYLICLSGMLVVVAERWQRWEQPAIAEMAAITPTAVQNAVAARMTEDRAAGHKGTTHLYVRMPTRDMPRTVVTSDHGANYVDAVGRPAGAEGHAWTEFLIELHTYLHLPITFGMIVVGGFGAMLAALAITGVVAHPRIIRDAFRLRARGNRQLAQADWHNRLGVWTLPFTLALALTGAIIGLSMVGATALGQRYYNGDMLKAYEPIFGAEHPADARAVPVADVVTPLRTMTTRFPEASPVYVTIHDPGTAGQQTHVLAEHDRRLIYGEDYVFDATGRYIGKTGLSDGELGRQAVASTYNLHFGNFGGLPVALAYMAMGLALCVVTATGMSLWLMKRRRRGLPSPRLEAFWAWIVWGSPILMIAALWLRAVVGAEAPLVPAFWGALAAGIAVAVGLPAAMAPARLRTVLAAAVGATALGHLALAWDAPGPVVAIDLVLLAAAGVIAVFGDWSVRREPRMLALPAE